MAKVSPLRKKASRPFFGRRDEIDDFRPLFKKSTASLVTCQGRRRVGKSRFIEKCAEEADHFLRFSGLAPRPNLGKREQLDNFAEQLASQTPAPKVKLDGWAAAFQLLATQLPAQGSVVVLFDEISWMAIGDKDFAGHLKNAWDDHYSKRMKLIVVICGSVSSWIEENILNSTAFVGRCTWQFQLGPLKLSDCASFWGKAGERISTADKLRCLCVTGGIPKYLEELDPKLTAEQNIARLCFHPGGILFNDFEAIFNDIFSRRAESYREIVKTLVDGSKTLDQISQALERERGGSLSRALQELETSGFLRRDASVSFVTNRELKREVRWRLSDNYLRFYLKYVQPKAAQIKNGRYRGGALESLTNWDVVQGLQFENLVLDNLDRLCSIIGLSPAAVLHAAPYSQRAIARRKGCQIDLLIQTKRSLYLFEMKFRRQIEASVVDEVDRKIRALKNPNRLSIRPGLIYEGSLAPSIEESEAFDYLIPASSFLSPSP